MTRHASTVCHLPALSLNLPRHSMKYGQCSACPVPSSAWMSRKQLPLCEVRRLGVVVHAPQTAARWISPSVGQATMWNVQASADMCGRIALYDEPDHLARLLDAGVDPDVMAEWRPGWNLAPTDRILGVTERHDRASPPGLPLGTGPELVQDSGRQGHLQRQSGNVGHEAHVPDGVP